MENNFICSWLLFYSQSNSRPQDLKIVDVESDYEIKMKLCSSLPYIECAENLHFGIEKNKSGFSAIFHYFSHHKGKVMDKLKDDEQKSYINALMNYEIFSMKHHISLIKCYMKAYVCDLAPLVRVRRAFVAMGVSNNIDTDEETFRNIQKHLQTWLNRSATKGLQRLLQKSNKMFSEADAMRFIGVSSLTSQLVYCMFYYAQTKMIQFTISVPDVNTIINNEPAIQELTTNHASIVIKAFSEICDYQDVFPIQTDKLSSVTMDSVPVTLTIALVFHWIFGNSLKTLENLLKMSTSTDSMQNSPGSSRPTSIFINSNTKKLEETKPMKNFHVAARPQPTSDNFSQIFSSRKVIKERNMLNDSSDNKLNNDGDTSPEIFLTPTEEYMPMTFSMSGCPTTKLLGQKPILVNSTRNKSAKDDIPEQMTISLKSEFQKKQQQKASVQKPKVTLMTTNETTWLAQKNKNDTSSIPLTPKKSFKSLPSPTHSNAQTLSKAQFNELQIQLGLKRQKIQTNLKKTVKETEKNVENSKQKVFFKVLNNKTIPDRRNSLESEISLKKSNGHNFDKRLSLFFDNDTNENKLFPGTSPIINSVSDQMSESIPPHKETAPSLNYAFVEEHNIENDKYEENISQMDIPLSLQDSDIALAYVQIIPDQVVELPPDNTDYQMNSFYPTNLNNISEVSFLEEERALSKNSSTSMSSLSSVSNKSSDKMKEDYYKSIDFLNKSLSSIHQEIKVLAEQQLSWSKRMQSDPSKSEMLLETSVEIKAQIQENNSENNSVPETPTNNIVSLTEVSDISKTGDDCSPTSFDPIGDNALVSCIPQIPISNNLPLFQHSLSQQEGAQIIQSDKPRELQFQDSQSLITLDDSNAAYSNLKRSLTVVLPAKKRKEQDMYKELENENDFVVENRNTDTNEENNNSIIQSLICDEDNSEMSSSTDSSIVSNAQPIAFVISTPQEIEEAQKKKAELLARREEKRRLKLELLKQKRDQEREDRMSATIDELMEREEKKRLEKEKRDSLLQKYLDRKKSETTSFSSNVTEKRSASEANTPVKLRVNSRTPRTVAVSGKQDSVGNLPLASSQKSTWFSSMRISHRNTSQSTSKLDENLIMDSNKFGIPLPPQEYTGPKLFGKRKVKTNRSVIVNAISHCCLAGSVNEGLKETVLKELADADGTHFMILFRDARCQYRAVYTFNLATDELNLIFGSGPKKISHDMVEKFYKYNSGAKQFNLIISTKHLSPAVDAICIQSLYWNSRPGSQLLTNAVSISNINQSKPKKKSKSVSMTN